MRTISYTGRARQKFRLQKAYSYGLNSNARDLGSVEWEEIALFQPSEGKATRGATSHADPVETRSRQPPSIYAVVRGSMRSMTQRKEPLSGWS
jgi:hypothetical protein